VLRYAKAANGPSKSPEAAFRLGFMMEEGRGLADPNPAEAAK